MARVLIIGAQGVLGSFLAAAFSESEWHVTRAGRRQESAADFLLLDLDDEEALAAALDAADVTVNTAHHAPLGPERVALRQGAILIDLVELGAAERDALRDEADRSSGLLVADVGLSFVAYLALADLLRRIPDADAATYALMFSAAGSSGRAGARFAHALLTSSRHHRTAGLELPEPWGATRAFEVASGTEDASMPEAIEGVPLRHYLSMQPRVLQASLLALNATRLISLLPAAAFTAGTGKVPSEPSDEPICEHVAVHRGGRQVGSRTIEGRGYYRMASAAILSLAEALLVSVERPTGFRPVEQVIGLASVEEALGDHGITVSEQR